MDLVRKDLKQAKTLIYVGAMVVTLGLLISSCGGLGQPTQTAVDQDLTGVSLEKRPARIYHGSYSPVSAGEKSGFHEIANNESEPVTLEFALTFGFYRHQGNGRQSTTRPQYFGKTLQSREGAEQRGVPVEYLEITVLKPRAGASAGQEIQRIGVTLNTPVTRVLLPGERIGVRWVY